MTEYQLTPATVDGRPEPNPLRWCFEEGEPECVVKMAPGLYLPPGITRNMRPSRVIGDADQPGEVVICRQTGGDTMGFAYPDTHRAINFEGITIKAGYRSAIMFRMNPPGNETFDDIAFINCWIDGLWDHATNTGETSKWGVLGNLASGFTWRGGGVKNIRWEHAFYFHNSGPAGVLLDGLTIENCGRTAVQSVARVSENGGVASTGGLILRNLSIRNVGLADGGSAITISGQRGRTRIENTSVLFDNPDHTGTGALVLWPEFQAGNPGKPGTPNGDVLISDCRFSFPTGKGDRPVVRISAVDRLYVEKTTINAGLNPIAVDINPTGRNSESMASDQFPLREYHDLGGNQVNGKVMVSNVWMNR